MSFQIKIGMLNGTMKEPKTEYYWSQSVLLTVSRSVSIFPSFVARARFFFAEGVPFRIKYSAILAAQLDFAPCLEGAIIPLYILSEKLPITANCLY
jgi:hypothetical protein